MLRTLLPSVRRRASLVFCAAPALASFALGVPAGAQSPPPNDDCANAIPLLDGLHSFLTIGATTDGQPHIECEFDGQTYEDVWYRYTSVCTGTLTVSTCGSASYDTDLVLYEGTDCEALVLVACEDDSGVCPNFTSKIEAPVTAGTEYTIRVGGFGPGATGAGTLVVSCAPACAVGLAASSYRNAAPNPASYSASAPLIGGDFEATVDTTMSGQPSSALFAFDGQANLPLVGGQVLLCIDTIGAGEIFTGTGLTPFATGGGVDRYLAPIPNVPSLCGRAVSSQALHFGAGAFVLSNAQDLVFGG